MENFEDIRPYYDCEINAAMKRIAQSPFFKPIMSYLYSGSELEEKIRDFDKISTTREFQQKIMDSAIRKIVEKTSSGFTFSGIENLEKGKSYLFISNHRDILLDSALLQIALFENGFDTTRITFGNNLMSNEFVVDIGRSNKMFKVIRSGSVRDFYCQMLHLSNYIRHSIMVDGESVWIAQRNGRTKDGIDKTDPAVVKMLSISSTEPTLESLSEINIVPVSISYQYEPCDSLKLRELYLSNGKSYIKAPGEDMNSICEGIIENKGGINLCISKPLSIEDIGALGCKDKVELCQSVSSLIDERIAEGYKLWNTNYIAFDLLNNSFDYTDKYSEEEKKNFAVRMHHKIDKWGTDADRLELMNIFLKIYASPVFNLLNHEVF